jgi:hypothetical protein
MFDGKRMKKWTGKCLKIAFESHRVDTTCCLIERTHMSEMAPSLFHNNTRRWLLSIIAVVAVVTCALLVWKFASFDSAQPVFNTKSALVPPRPQLSKQAPLPIPGFNDARGKWPSYQTLIIVPGHAIQHCTERDMSLYNVDCWTLLNSYQRNQVPIYVAHVRHALHELANRDDALLIMSGGKTHPGLSRMSEGTSLVALAERIVSEDPSLQQFNSPFDLLHRVFSEEFALDSHDNLLFSMCRFQQLTGHQPQHVVVAGFGFKQKRFSEIHRVSAGLSASAFEYIDVNPLNDELLVSQLGVEEAKRQTKLIDFALPPYRSDPFGCGPELRNKRRSRNMYAPHAPFAHVYMYALSCPSMRERLLKCEDPKQIALSQAADAKKRGNAAARRAVQEVWQG